MMAIDFVVYVKPAVRVFPVCVRKGLGQDNEPPFGVGVDASSSMAGTHGTSKYFMALYLSVRVFESRI